MSAINVNSITGRTGTHGPVLTGITTATNGIHVTGGSVGIGTDNPARKVEIFDTAATVLQLNSTSSDGTSLRIQNSGTDKMHMGLAGDFIIGQANNVTDSAIRSNGSLLFSSGGGTERLRIDSSGRLGIGATDLSAYELDADDLVIKQDSGNAGLTIHSASNGVGSIYFADGTTGTEGYRGRIEYNQSVDTMSFGTASTGSRVVIDDSGRLLVGTLSSDAQRTSKFQLAGNGDLSGWGSSLNLSEFGTSYNPWIVLQRSRNSTIGSHTVVNSGDILGGIQFNGSDGNSFESGAYIKCELDGSAGDGDMPGRLVFSTTADSESTPTERMRITSAGALLAFATGQPHQIFNNQTSGTESIFVVRGGASSITSTGTSKFVVRADGDVENATGVYTSPISDERFKTDIADVDSQWEDIKNVRLRKFRFKNNPDGELQLGIIAQELEPVCPNLIKRKIAGPEEVEDSGGAVQEGDEYLSWKASLLPLKAVKALQEAMERIETLEAEVAALKGA